MTNPGSMKTLELFAGAGLATEGLLAAGLDVVRCIEWDAQADATAKAAGHPSVCDDVRASTVYEHLPALDLVWASFPCQAWSTAGKREGANDERNGWPWVMDAVDFLRAGAGGPEWLICENVPGLTMHAAKAHEGGVPADPSTCPACYFARVILEQARARFASVQWTILDAADYGVPQRRHRLFLVCGPHPIRWPEATHADPAALVQAALFGPRRKPWVTVRQALGLGGTSRVTGGGSNPHGPDRAHERTERVLTDEPGLTHRAMDADRPADTIQAAGAEGGPRPPGILDDATRTIAQTRPDWSHRATGIDTPTRAIGTKANASVKGAGPTDRKTYPRGLGRAASEPERLDQPAPTVATTEEKGTRASAASGFTFNGGPDRASDAAFLGAGIRRLTVLECATLQGVRLDYPWSGTKTAMYRQIGNGVPPPLACAVAMSVVMAGRARGAA